MLLLVYCRDSFSLFRWEEQEPEQPIAPDVPEEQAPQDGNETDPGSEPGTEPGGESGTEPGTDPSTDSETETDEGL